MTEHETRSGAAEDALRRLEERLTRASEAAERLIIEVAESVGGGADAEDGARPAADGEDGARPAADAPPAAGWQSSEEDRQDRRTQDLALLLGFLERIRDLIPPDLQRRLGEAVRELLLAVRAVIDWYLERLERRRVAPVEVTDIPID